MEILVEKVYVIALLTFVGVAEWQGSVKDVELPEI